MAIIDFSHGGNIYLIKRKYKKEVIDFSANINPLGMPKEIKRALCKNMGRIFHYPDPEGTELSKKIAKYWKIEKDNILLGNGSTELIYLIVNTFKPETVLIPVPTFSEYERAARSGRSKIIFLKLKESANFRLDLSSIKKTDMFFLCNPNNPTGNLLIKNRNLNFKSKFFVIDEAFMDFLLAQRELTFIPEAVKSKNIIVIRSFTKFFSIPGLRLGYLIAHKDLARDLKKYQVPWSVNSFAQIAGKLLINDKDYISKTLKLIAKERKFLLGEINKIEKLECFPSVTNFLLIKLKDKRLTAKLLKKMLLDKKILIRDCSNFRNLGNKFFRVAVRKREENRMLVKALKELLD